MTPPMSAAQDLAKYTGLRINSLCRMSFFPPEDVYQTRLAKLHMPRTDVFPKAEGPIFLEFPDGRGLGIFTHEGAQSIHVWPLTARDDENPDDEWPISYDDPVYSNDYCKSIPGATIEDIIVHRANNDSGRPNQRAISFKLDNGMWFACLHTHTDFGSSHILCPYEDVEKYAPGLIVESMSVNDPRAKHTNWGAWDHA